jgi:rhamnosyltransferase
LSDVHYCNAAARRHGGLGAASRRERYPIVLPRVIAVVPTYRPDESVIDRLRSIAEQVHALIVVDDGTPKDGADIVDMVASAGFEVVCSESNRGIAAALNTGVKLALSRGADYVLTVDQDSVLPAGYVTDCIAVFVASPVASCVGVVCAEAINGHATRAGELTAEGFGILRVAIQSGFVVSAACFAECGLFDEALFIDCVDTEFCLRLADHGYRVVVAAGTDIEHSLGELVPVRPFGIARTRGKAPLTYEYHGPARRYFISRNGVDLYLRYLRRNPRWVLSSMRQELGPLAQTIASGPHRGRQLLAVVAGTVHGLVRKRGGLTPRLRRMLTPA